MVSRFVERGLSWMRSARREAVFIVKYAVPVICFYVLGMLIGLINIVYVGHLGPDELAAAALAAMFVNVTGYSLAVGMCGGIDTLGSQAYGAKNYEKVGLVAQRAGIAIGVLAVPVALFWLFLSETVLIASGQDPTVAHLAAVYARISVLGIPATFLFEILKRYLQVQGVMVPLALVMVVGVLANALLAYLFVFPFGLGFEGAPLSVVVTYYILDAALLVFVRVRGILAQTWRGWSRQALEWAGMKEYLKLALPNTLGVCAEWWCFELTAMLAGWLGVEALGVQSILLSTFSMCYMVPLGISVAASTRVGNLLGADRPKRARTAAQVVMAATIALQTIVALVLLGVRNVLARVFTNDEAVIALTGRVLSLTFAIVILDGTMSACWGVLRGCGKQRVMAIAGPVGFYVIGLPLGMLFAFVAHLQLFGLWMGMYVADITLVIVYLVVILRIDWPQVAHAAALAASAERPADGSEAAHDPEGFTLLGGDALSDSDEDDEDEGGRRARKAVTAVTMAALNDDGSVPAVVPGDDDDDDDDGGGGGAGGGEGRAGASSAAARAELLRHADDRPRLPQPSPSTARHRIDSDDGL